MRAGIATLFLVAALAVSGARAQALVDPMRPAGAGHESGDTAVARTAGPVLEQIVLGDGRKFAVISGRRVVLGEKVGDATVVGIEPDQVVLKGGATQVLRMFPSTDKRGASANGLPPGKAEAGS